ncbi:hypothetical protein BH09VER1_BH09VER1_09690 [soil metagenome]
MNALRVKRGLAIHEKPTKAQIHSREAAAKEGDPQISLLALVRLWVAGRP